MHTTTDQPTTTASATPDKVRTVPADKPTAIKTSQPYAAQDQIVSVYSTALAKANAHADKLAEALQELDMAHNHKTLVVAKQNARAALQSYEASRQ
jgi:hypothetical protein